MEIYIIVYTFAMIIALWLYSLPFKTLGGAKRGLMNTIHFKKVWRWKKLF